MPRGNARGIQDSYSRGGDGVLECLAEQGCEGLAGAGGGPGVAADRKGGNVSASLQPFTHKHSQGCVLGTKKNHHCRMHMVNRSGHFSDYSVEPTHTIR